MENIVISEVKSRLDVILIASGSEVTLAMQLKHELLKSFIEARIVSMPNVNEFLKQPQDYQNQVLPKGYKNPWQKENQKKGIRRELLKQGGLSLPRFCSTVRLFPFLFLFGTHRM